VPEDDAAAADWMKRAALKRFPEAQNNLAMFYAHGKGVPQDDAQAAYWCKRAAWRGLAAAQNNLGGMYEHGRGVPRSFVQAYKWYDIALRRFPKTDEHDRAIVSTNREAVSAKMTPGQIAKGKRLSRQWRYHFAHPKAKARHAGHAAKHSAARPPHAAIAKPAAKTPAKPPSPPAKP
jgi:hypothetical protein